MTASQFDPIRVPARPSRDRWARGDEQSCDSGGCRNLAVWMIRSDLIRTKDTCRTFLSCHLHLASKLRLLRQRRQVWQPEILPFQDADDVPSTKRKRRP